MLKSIWYLFKVLVVIGFTVFLAVQPGTVEFSWRDYTFRDLHLGAALVILFLTLLCVALLTGLLYRLFSLPREYMRVREEKRRAKGYQALVRSLTAAATGDHKNAYYLAHRAQKLLPETEAGIPLLLQAHAARGRGNAVDTDHAFQALLKNADTALLGVQGLIQKSVIEGDFAHALQLARNARSAQPHNHSLLKPLYDLEIRNQLWADALQTLDRAVSKKIIAKDVANNDRIAIYCLLGDKEKVAGRRDDALNYYKKAVSLAPSFAPAVDRLARHYFETGRRNKAQSLVKDAWIKQAHPDLLPLWDMLCPKDQKDQRAARYRWFEWVQEFHPDSQVAVLALAKAAIEEGLWGEARAALARAEKLGPSTALYNLWVMLEERTGNKPEVIRQWLDRAAKAPQPQAWVCQKTGRHFDHWVGVVEPEGLFNTVIWGERTSQPETAPQWLLDKSVA